jgi:hypothetical protein
VPIERLRIVERARAGEFDLVVVGDVWRSWGLWAQLLTHAPTARIAVLDGADWATLFPYSRRLLASPARAIPRPHVRASYFKREWTPRTAASRFLHALPPSVAARVWRPPRLHPISFAIPAERLARDAPGKDRLFATQVVDPEVAAGLGRTGTGYAFTEEDAYYDDLRRSRFGITMKRAGWDCLRHYELAASGCIPCFRELDRKPATCAPHGLVPGGNCLAYDSWAGLIHQVESLSTEQEAHLRQGTLAWAAKNTTVERARQLLRVLGYELP